MVDVDHILQTELPQEDREVLAEDKRRWQRMGAGQHLSDWLAYAPGLRIRRKLAMRVNFTNKPEGRGYTETYGQLLRLAGLDVKDKRLMTTLTAIAWLDDDLERMTILRELLDAMTAGERSRLNSPISARQRVEGVLKARAGDTEEKLRNSPVAILKQHNMELVRQLAHAEDKLAAADAGSLFDLQKDSVANIAKVIRETITPSRAQSLADQLRPPRTPTVSEAAKVFVEAVKTAGLTKEQRAKEVRRLLPSLGITLHENFGI
jgi:hypothetical protein